MSALARLVLTLAAAPLLSACTSVPRGVTPVESFEIDRYLGQWYEIARLDHSFERGLSHVTARYDLREDGRVGVLNSGFHQERGTWSQAQGVARFQGDPSVASLSVTFRWPFSGGYHVIALDQEDYQWALVSGPTRGYLWILAREPQLDEAIVAQLVDTASQAGFPTEELLFIEHAPPPPIPRPD